MILFVDTSIFYAAVDSSDKSNKSAKAILASDQSVLTSNLVLAESWNLINNKIGKVAAERFWGGVRTSAIEIESVSPADFDFAWQTGIDWPDQDFSLVDRTTFAVMQRLGIKRVATLDSDFVIYRFGPRRRSAFTVLP
jgi:uncharacterized protein